MPTINTLRGPVDTADLGRTLMHEHVAIRTPGIGENWPDLWDEDGCIEAAHQKFTALESRGIGTIVDLTTADMGRDIQYLQRVAEGTGINIVLASGIYWIVPRYWVGRDADALAAAFAQQQRHPAFEAQGEAEIAAARQQDGAAAGGRGGEDRGVDRVAVDRPAIAARAMVAHVEAARGMGWERQGGEAPGDQAQRHVAAAHRHRPQLPAGR